MIVLAKKHQLLYIDHFERGLGKILVLCPITIECKKNVFSFHILDGARVQKFITFNILEHMLNGSYLLIFTKSSN